MAAKTFAELAVQTTIANGDLFASYRGTGPLKSVDAALIAPYVLAGVGGTSGHVFGWLDGLNVFSALQTISIGTAATAGDYLALKPTDYGTGKPGLFISKTATAATWQVQLYDGTNNAGQIDLKLGLLNITGAMTLSGVLTCVAPVVTGGMTFSGSNRQNVNAVAVLDIDASVSEFHTKSISANSTFTFSGATASKGMAFILNLTITSAAVPTWPASVKWSAGTAPTLGNGRHVLGFITFDGGTIWTGVLGSFNAS